MLIKEEMSETHNAATATTPRATAHTNNDIGAVDTR